MKAFRSKRVRVVQLRRTANHIEASTTASTSLRKIETAACSEPWRYSHNYRAAAIWKFFDNLSNPRNRADVFAARAVSGGT